MTQCLKICAFSSRLLSRVCSRVGIESACFEHQELAHDLAEYSYAG